jgi:hypothetical protein
VLADGKVVRAHLRGRLGPYAAGVAVAMSITKMVRVAVTMGHFLRPIRGLVYTD